MCPKNDGCLLPHRKVSLGTRKYQHDAENPEICSMKFKPCQELFFVFFFITLLFCLWNRSRIAFLSNETELCIITSSKDAAPESEDAYSQELVILNATSCSLVPHKDSSLNVLKIFLDHYEISQVTTLLSTKKTWNSNF